MDDVEIQRVAEEHGRRHSDHNEFDAPPRPEAAPVSETRRFDTLEAHQGLEHLLRKAHPLEGRPLQREHDQCPVDVSLGSKNIGIERAHHRAKLIQGQRSCPHTVSLPRLGSPIRSRRTRVAGGTLPARLRPASRRADHLTPHELDLKDLIASPECALYQLGRLTPLEECASARLVPSVGVVGHVVVEDEPCTGEHAADDQVASRIVRVCDPAKQLPVLRRRQTGHVLQRWSALLRIPGRCHATS